MIFLNFRGRIGHYGGQFQNTPFSNKEQVSYFSLIPISKPSWYYPSLKAVEEFEKIFKSKTGNEWKARNDFQIKKGKYRPVNEEKLHHVKKSALAFDLESGTEIPSKLPKAVALLMKDLGNVSMYIKVSKTRLHKVSRSTQRCEKIVTSTCIYNSFASQFSCEE